jgi:hypothetical protein
VLSVRMCKPDTPSMRTDGTDTLLECSFIVVDVFCVATCCLNTWSSVRMSSKSPLYSMLPQAVTISLPGISLPGSHSDAFGVCIDISTYLSPLM